MAIVTIIILSILLAVLMKTADNLNEHGLKLFKGANLIFGILWGIVGTILMLQNNTLFNVWLAVFIGLTLRAKQDKLNHGLAIGIIFTVFLLNLNKYNFNPQIYWTFFLGMIVFGLIHDYLSSRAIVKKIYSELFHTLFFYALMPLIFGFITGNWMPFYSLFSFVLAYEITRYFGDVNLLKNRNEKHIQGDL